MHACAHARRNVCKPTHPLLRMPTCKYAHMFAYAHALNACMHGSMHVYTQARKHACTRRACTHARMHVFACTCANACKHNCTDERLPVTHTHTHKCACACVAHEHAHESAHATNVCRNKRMRVFKHAQMHVLSHPRTNDECMQACTHARCTQAHMNASTCARMNAHKYVRAYASTSC